MQATRINRNPELNCLGRLDSLARRLLDLKTEKKDIDKEIKDIEEKIIAEMGVKEKGTLTVCGDRYKVKTVASEIIKVDQDKFKKLRSSNLLSNESMKELFRVEVKLNKKPYDESGPKTKSAVDECITVKPAKVAVSAELIEGS